MANIKGITVEIGGDTTGLQKSLKSVNSVIKGTQSELKQITNLLKLDPHHTELLSQKQQTLKRAISETKDKLDILKTAEAQAKAQMESGDLGKDKYDAIQREIVETEEELKRLIRESAEADKTLSRLNRVGEGMEKAGNKMAGVGRTLSTCVTGPIVAAGAAAVKTAADFDTSMSKVGAISGAAGEDLQALREKAVEMGGKTVFSASQAADAMGYMAMAGWKTGDMLKGIEGIMHLAAASGEDLAVTSDIVTDALTAFGLKASDSGHFADVLAAASANANTNVALMGETFKYAAPVAGALGYSAEDTAIAIGMMANAGIKSSQAGTALRSGLTRLAKPTKQVRKAMEQYGISLTDSNGEMLSMRDLTLSLREKLGGLDTAEQAAAAAAIFGTNAMSGWLAVINGSDEDLKKLTGAIDGCQGAAKGMADTMNDNLNGQLTLLKSAVESLMISIGDALMPTVRKVIALFQSWMDKLNGMDEGQRNLLIRIAAIAAAIGPVLVVMGTVIAKTGTILKAVSALGKGIMIFTKSAKLGVGAGGKMAAAVSGLSAPALGVAAAVAALGAAFVHLWKSNDDFRTNVTACWERVKSAFRGLADKIGNLLGGIQISFSTVTAAISAIWERFCALLSPLLTAAVSGLASAFSSVLDVISGVLDVFAGLFTGDWGRLWSGLKQVFEGVWNGLSGIASAALEAVKGAANVVLGWFGTNWNALWTNVSTAFREVWNGIVSYFTGILNGIRTTVESIWGAIVSFFTGSSKDVRTSTEAEYTKLSGALATIWAGIRDALTGIVSSLAKGIINAWTALQTALLTLTSGLAEGLIRAWNALCTGVSSLVSGLASGVIEAWTALKAAVTAIVTTLHTALVTAWESIRDAVTTLAQGICQTVAAAWESAKKAVLDAVTGIIKAWDAAKTSVINIADNMRTGLVSAWEGAKQGIKKTVSTLASDIQTGWASMKTGAQTAMEGIRAGIVQKWEEIKSGVSNLASSIASGVASGWNNLASTASSVWTTIRNTIAGKIEDAKRTVSSCVEAIKGVFNFSWSLPKIKLPHFSVTGKFSLNPPSIPKFSISWYRKAMDNGMILNGPTIFGQKGNTLLAGGEAGSETVVGTRSLMEMIRKTMQDMHAGTTISYGGVTVNVYAKENQDIRALADEIEYRINSNMQRRRAAQV